MTSQEKMISEFLTAHSQKYHSLKEKATNQIRISIFMESNSEHQALKDTMAQLNYWMVERIITDGSTDKKFSADYVYCKIPF